MKIKQIIHKPTDNKSITYPFSDSPCIKIIIQGWPGTQFSINSKEDFCILDKTGYFELDLSKNNLGMITSISVISGYLNNEVLIDCYLQD